MSGICSVHDLLSVLVTLRDTRVGILIDLMVFIEGIA